LSHHVNDLQFQLIKAQGLQRIPRRWGSSMWQRLAGRRAQFIERPVRENRRKLSHALHSA
jgi:hypothetical protein